MSATKTPTPAKAANASVPARQPLLRAGSAIYDRPWGVLDAAGWISGRAYPTEGEAIAKRDELNAAVAANGPFRVSAIRRPRAS